MGHEFASPLRRWDVVAGLCQQLGATGYVEVGCKEGRTTAFVLNALADLRAVAIDPWSIVPASDDPTRETYAEWDFGKIESDFWSNIGDNKDRCNMLRMSGAQVAARWVDLAPLGWKYVDGTTFGATRAVLPDVVFVDALHDFDSVIADLDAWFPLLRPGGFLCGHDFNHKWPGVMRAVAQRFPLVRVGVCPDSVWFVQKNDAEELRAAA